MVLFLAICTETTNLTNLRLSEISTELLFNIILSGVLAVGVNFFSYAIIGRFSAVTFQVVGNLKTILTLTIGHYIFHVDHPTQRSKMLNYGGMAIATVSAASYGYLKSREARIEEKYLEIPEMDTEKPKHDGILRVTP